MPLLLSNRPSLASLRLGFCTCSAHHAVFAPFSASRHFFTFLPLHVAVPAPVRFRIFGALLNTLIKVPKPTPFVGPQMSLVAPSPFLFPQPKSKSNEIDNFEFGAKLLKLYNFGILEYCKIYENILFPRPLTHLPASPKSPFVYTYPTPPTLIPSPDKHIQTYIQTHTHIHNP